MRCNVQQLTDRKEFPQTVDMRRSLSCVRKGLVYVQARDFHDRARIRENLLPLS